MGNELAQAAARIELTDEQREAFLAQLRDDNTIGLVRALRNAGVEGTRGQLRQLISSDEQLQDDTRLARGWNLNRVEGVAWEVALDKEHPSWDRANARVLKAYHPAYRDQSRVEHTGLDGGPLEVSNPDVAAALDRFTSTVTRLAARAAESSGAVRELEPGRAGEAPPSSGA